MFIIREENKFQPIKNFNENQKVDYLPSGIYTEVIERGFLGMPTNIYYKKEEEEDNLIEINKGTFGEIQDYIDRFFNGNLRKLYNDLDFKYKTGVMMHGPPGTGKTSLVRIICQKMVKEKDAICCFAQSIDDLASIVDTLRGEDSVRPCVLVLEELDHILAGGDIDNFLNFLDGIQSRDNVLVLATTNDVNNIPPKITDRPSRFSLIKEIDKIPDELVDDVIKEIIPDKYEKIVDLSKIIFDIKEGQDPDSVDNGDKGEDLRFDKIKHKVIKALESEIEKYGKNEYGKIDPQKEKEIEQILNE